MGFLASTWMRALLLNPAFPEILSRCPFSPGIRMSRWSVCHRTIPLIMVVQRSHLSENSRARAAPASSARGKTGRVSFPRRGILRRAISMRTETAKHNSERVSTALSLVLLRQIGQLEALAFSVANPRNPTRPPVRRANESAKPEMRRKILERPRHLDLSHFRSILPGVVKACYMLIVFLLSFFSDIVKTKMEYMPKHH